MTSPPFPLTFRRRVCAGERFSPVRSRPRPAWPRATTAAALFLPGMFSAFGTFLLRQFFMALPKKLEEAARIDGAGSFPIFWSIMLPLIRPALAALAVITAVWSWNDLLWPLVVNTGPAKMPISAGLTSLEGQFETNYPVMMAGSLIASLPVIVLYLFLQRHFVQGIAQSGTKGLVACEAEPHAGPNSRFQKGTP
ncbi:MULTISPECIES: carbohydrate ABC transporter permease [unclassified Streptomyces]|uniref:carbohydrate ABC transporter permease n=1 Tax=unclassified Streptomyces TaxID=2593676 RepID=UPI002E37B97C|nr:carbohydrate ABC transporter permease [Streptomyces sp. NBC_01280]WSE20225.1 carbohydrate ABC transporter permease [Streptomyces sp. NBC_01397]